MLGGIFSGSAPESAVQDRTLGGGVDGDRMGGVFVVARVTCSVSIILGGVLFSELLDDGLSVHMPSLSLSSPVFEQLPAPPFFL